MENTKKKAEPVSALTVNLRFGLADDGPNSWIYRKKSFYSLFQAFQPDFIAAQEANDFQIDYLDKILKEYNFIGKLSPAPRFWQHPIIFYKKSWACVYNKHFFLSHTPHIPSRLRDSIWPRQCIMGMFEKENQSIICISTHLDFKSSVRVESANIILDQLAYLPFKAPVIIMGDFNAKPGSPCYNIFTTKHDSNSLPFQDILEGKISCTHHGFTGKCIGGQIDWILYRGMKVKESRVISDKFENTYPSDHFPVHAVFDWIS
ncbi:Endonuclease/exonuclease/phosphatase domain-containing protein [Candidatus Magnetomoraceae bacterium gMMP-15]